MQVRHANLEEAIRAEAEAEYESEVEAEVHAHAQAEAQAEEEDEGGSAVDVRGGDVNRRRAPRAVLTFAVDLTSEHNFYGGFSENLSSTGVFVASYDLLPLGEVLHLRFTLPDGVTVENDAVVRWVREPTFASDLVPPGMGLEFVKLSSEGQAAVDRFVAARDPIFFPE